jgi:hypothetical protein
VLAGAIAAIAALRIGATPLSALFVGAATFAITVAAQSWYASQSFAKLQAGHRPLFPTPD